MNFTTGTYQGTGPFYYWVSPVLGPGDVTNSSEIWDWCAATFGLPGAYASKAWMAGNNRYYFQKEADRAFFILRWS